MRPHADPSHDSTNRRFLLPPSPTQTLTAGVPAAVGAVRSEPAAFTLTAFAIATGLAQVTLSISNVLWLAVLGWLGAAGVTWLKQDKKWWAAAIGGLFVGVLLAGIIAFGSEIGGLGKGRATTVKVVDEEASDEITPPETSVRVRLSTIDAAMGELFDGDLLVAINGIARSPQDAYVITFTISDLTGRVDKLRVEDRGIGEQVEYGAGCRYLVTVGQVTEFWAVILISERPPLSGQGASCPP